MALRLADDGYDVAVNDTKEEARAGLVEGKGRRCGAFADVAGGGGEGDGGRCG